MPKHAPGIFVAPALASLRNSTLTAEVSIVCRSRTCTHTHAHTHIHRKAAREALIDYYYQLANPPISTFTLSNLGLTSPLARLCSLN